MDYVELKKLHRAQIKSLRAINAQLHFLTAKGIDVATLPLFVRKRELIKSTLNTEKFLERELLIISN